MKDSLHRKQSRDVYWKTPQRLRTGAPAREQVEWRRVGGEREATPHRRIVAHRTDDGRLLGEASGGHARTARHLGRAAALRKPKRAREQCWAFSEQPDSARGRVCDVGASATAARRVIGQWRASMGGSVP
jgi:hypothetical protein